MTSIYLKLNVGMTQKMQCERPISLTRKAQGLIKSNQKSVSTTLEEETSHFWSKTYFSSIRLLKKYKWPIPTFRKMIYHTANTNPLHLYSALHFQEAFT